MEKTFRNFVSRAIAYLRARWIKIYFYAAVLLVVFAYGLAAGMFGLFPAQQVRQGIKAGRDWVSNAEHYARIRPDKHLRDAKVEGDGVTVLDVDRVWPGYTLMSAMWGEQLGFRLVNLKGEILHEWPVSFNAVWPAADHLRIQPHDWDTVIHGFVVYPNGNITFNFEHHGTVAIDSCSNVIWKLPRETHHDIYRAESGNLWIPDSKLVTQKDPRFPLLSPPFYEELILQVSPSGEVLQEISVLDILAESGYGGLLVDPAENVGGGNWKGTVKKDLVDITHLNDVDILPGRLAEKFALFDKGDMLLSLRNLDLLIVVDSKTHKIKWAKTGPWLMQHDPDFGADGKILVYDNRARNWATPAGKGSRILEVDPVSRKVNVRYQGSKEHPFFSSQMGTQQALPNGNLLITEPDGGRVIEVANSGEIVWEYVNRWSANKVAIISGAKRIDADFFEEATFGCRNKNAI